MPAQAWANDDLPFTLFNGVVQTNPTSVGFDALVKTAIESSFNSGESHRASFLDDYWGGVARSSFRWQFSHTHSAPGSNSFGIFSQSMCEIWDITGGRPILKIGNLSANGGGNNNENVQASYWNGSAWVTFGTVFDLPQAKTVHTLTIKLHATTGILQWHVNGALMASITGNTLLSGSTTADTVKHYCWGNSGLGTFRNTFAEHILCDIDFQVYGLRVTDRFVTGTGTYSQQASGIPSDVGETAKNTATVATIDTVGNTMSVNVDDLDASLATSSIIGIMLGVLARRGDTGPQTVKVGYVLASGGLQLSAAKAINGVGFTPLGLAVFTNPATTQPFTYAIVNSTEVAAQGAT